MADGASTAEIRKPGGWRIVLFGPPNSGKGTQAEVLAGRLGVPAISTGDMLRAARDAGTELGRRVADIMAAGELVDDDTMAEVVEDRLAHTDARGGFLLDGYPRTLAQAGTLEGILDASSERLDAVVLIRVPEEELVRRGLERGREDDSESVIRERLRVYREKTEPVLGYYRKKDLLREVDGDRAVPEVTSGILAALPASGGRS